jgi:hypothetical protein
VRANVRRGSPEKVAAAPVEEHVDFFSPNVEECRNFDEAVANVHSLKAGWVYRAL